MSFGCSPSDIVTLVQLTTRAYNNWKNACGEYAEITGQLSSLNVIVKRLSTEATTPNSPLQRENGDYINHFKLLDNSAEIVTQLNNVVVKFQSLGRSRRSNWDRLKLANRNLDEMRSKLTLHVSLLSAFLDSIGISALGRIEQDVGDLPEMRNTINKIATAMGVGKRGGSVMTEYGNDDRAIWRDFRRELIGEGFSSASIRKYKQQLKDYLRALQAGGILDEDATPSPCELVGSPDILPGLREALLQETEQLPLIARTGEQANGELRAYRLSPSKRRRWTGAALQHSRPLLAVTTAGLLSPALPFGPGAEDQASSRTHDGQWNSLEGHESLPTDYEQRAYTRNGESSSRADEDWIFTKDDAANFAHASHSIWLFTNTTNFEHRFHPLRSSIVDVGSGAESGDTLSDSDDGVEDQATEVIYVVSKLNEKRESFLPHRTPPLPDGWLCKFDHDHGLLFVDEWAGPSEHKVFLLPPEAEKYPNSPLPGGWRRTQSVTGRISWLHESGLVSHEHPGYSDCIRIGCISHDKCMRILGHFRNAYEGREWYDELEAGELPRWEHVGINSRVLYDNFRLYGTTLGCQMTSTSWYQRPRPVAQMLIEPTEPDDDRLPPSWQKRHDSLGKIYFVHRESKNRTSVDPGWSRIAGSDQNVERPLGWRQEHDQQGQVCFVEQSNGLENKSLVDPFWKEQWKVFFLHQKHEASSGSSPASF